MDLQISASGRRNSGAGKHFCRVKSARWVQGAVSGPVSTCYQSLWELSVLSPWQAGSLPADSPFAWNIHKQCLIREGPGYRKVSVLVLTTFRESHALYFLIVLCLFLLSPFSKCSSFNIRLSQVVTILEKSIAVIYMSFVLGYLCQFSAFL